MKIGYYKFSSFSLVNEKLYKELTKQLPKAEIELIDIEAKIYKRKSIANLLISLFFYWKDIVLFRRKLNGMVLHSPYYFKMVKKNINNYTKARNFEFTIQTQSLWDAKTKGVPHFVYTDHTELAFLKYIDSRLTYPQFWTNLEETIYKNADINFTTSNFAAKSIIEDYGIVETKVKCIYSGINHSKTSYKQYQKNYHSKNILFIGTQWERKGGPQLIEAFKKIKKLHPSTTLTIIGCTPSIDIQGCNVVGFIKNDKIHRYLLKAQIFCLPSLVEPSSVAMVEAYSYFLPVVATNTGGSADRVINGHTGFLVKPGDIELLVERLVELIEDADKCRKFGLNGNILLKKQFTWPVVVKKMLNDIDEFLNPTEIRLSKS